MKQWDVRSNVKAEETGDRKGTFAQLIRARLRQACICFASLYLTIRGRKTSEAIEEASMTLWGVQSRKSGLVPDVNK